MTLDEDPDQAVLEFLHVMRRLRAECPWKAQQTHRSLARYLLEETHETLEALDTGDDDHLREELGDLLLQVFFHAAIAEQDEAFTMADVARDITEKMYRRNPHVFAEDRSSSDLDAAGVDELWEAAKAQEKQRTGVTDGLPPGLPALAYADKLLGRLERAGTPAVVPADSDDLGDRLLALVAEARESGTDPEQALRDAVHADKLLDRLERAGTPAVVPADSGDLGDQRLAGRRGARVRHRSRAGAARAVRRVLLTGRH